MDTDRVIVQFPIGRMSRTGRGSARILPARFTVFVTPMCHLSVRQKGLIQAVRTVFPGHPHVHCTVHLERNVRPNSVQSWSDFSSTFTERVRKEGLMKSCNR